MRSKALRSIYMLVVPGGLILAAAFAIVRFYHFPVEVDAILPWLPYAVVVAGVLLSMRFNCGRIMWTLILLAMVDGVLRSYGVRRPDLSGTIFACVSLLTPVNLMILSMTPERGATRRVTGSWLFLILCEVAAVVALCTLEPAGANEFLHTTLVDWPPLSASQLSQVSLFAFVLATIVLLVNFLESPRPSESGLFWMLVCAFLLLNHPLDAVMFGYIGSIAGIILIVSLVETSYHMAFLDELTGLPGRRAFHDATSKLGWNYTLAMVDVDHFKQFNDTYGHDCGDQVLRLVAAKLAVAPGKAQAFRYGGEEFCLIFPNKTAKQTLEHLDDLRQQIAETKFKVRAPERRKKPNGKAKAKTENKKVQVTVSIGAANFDKRNNLVEKVLVAADKALYRAKDAGRNCVMLAAR